MSVPDLALVPADKDALLAAFREVESHHAAEQRRKRNGGRLAWGVAGLSLAANLALAFALASLAPSVRLVPLILVNHDDGTIDSYSSLSAMPASQQEADIRAALWQYVLNRESYSYADAQYRWTLVGMMSVPSVRDSYEKGFDWKDNPQSPQNTYGKKGQIDVKLISLSMVRPQVALVRYQKSALLYGARPIVTTWTATIGFRMLATIPAAARYFDPAGLQVTTYQSLEDSPR
jgi:type IV secretion system protein VirB8